VIRFLTNTTLPAPIMATLNMDEFLLGGVAVRVT
jgi:hypothetical protein